VAKSVVVPVQQVHVAIRALLIASGIDHLSFVSRKSGLRSRRTRSLWGNHIDLMRWPCRFPMNSLPLYSFGHAPPDSNISPRVRVTTAGAVERPLPLCGVARCSAVVRDVLMSSYVYGLK